MWELVLLRLGKERRRHIYQGRRTPEACPHRAISVHIHLPGLVSAGLCFQQREAAWPAHSVSPGSHIASCRALPGLPGPASWSWGSCSVKASQGIALHRSFHSCQLRKASFSCCCLAVWQQNKWLYLRDLKICLLLHVFQSLSRFKFSPLE